ncbi:MAG: nucleoside triphosphate pyrophosphohydrolase [Bacteroidota bacterium]
MPAPSYRRIPAEEFKGFVRIVRRLRRDCPWDRKQTHRSLRGSLIEETYEVVEAIDGRETDELKRELGDLMLHVIMHATIAEQSGEFTLRDVFEEVSNKLVRRHPHVFGTRRARSAREVKRSWEALKLEEGRSSLLDGVPKTLPSLQRAYRVQQRAAKVGFDWSSPEEVWEKVREELEELKQAVKARGAERREEEFGDLLFALVNFARFVKVNPENALRRTVQKFDRRFRLVEKELRKRGKDPRDSTLAEMDRYWNSAKRGRH